MKALLDNLPLLTVFPYALLYFLILLCASLLAVLALRKASASGCQPAPALRSALFMIFIAQVLLLTLSLLIFQGFDGLVRYFPLVFHALTLLTLIWLSAGLLSDRLNARQTRLPLILSGLTVLAGALSVLAWSTWPADKAFSGSVFSLAWSAAALLVLFVALVLALRSQRPHKLERVLILLTAALGYLVNILFPLESALPSGVMLSQLLYYPLLISAAWQFRRGEQARAAAVSSPRMASALLDVGLLSRAEEIRASFTHSLSLYLMGDVVGILEKDPQSPALSVGSAYDLISEATLPAFSLPFSQAPKLRRHFEDLVPLIANADEQLAGEKQALMRASGFNTCGPLLLFPFGSRALLCFNPYTQRAWTSADLDALSPLSDKLSQVLERTAAVEAFSALKDESRYLANQMEREKRDLADSLSTREAELAALISQRANDQAAYTAELRVREQRQKYLEAQLEALHEKLQAQQSALSELDALREQKSALERSLQENEQRALSLRRELENARAALGDLLGKAGSAPAGTETSAPARSDQSAAGAEEHAPENSPTRAALQNKLDELAASFYSRRVAHQLTFGALPELGPAALACVAQVFENLVINAFAASPPESEVAFSLAPARLEDGRPAVEILAAHAGQSLSPQEQQHLPEALLGEHAEASAGIGDFNALSAAARQLRACGGHLWLKSETDQQTLWRALIPLDGALQGLPQTE
ncbi:MAG: hypothetical protein ABFD21_04005 [Anaerolineaceae bacterium]